MNRHHHSLVVASIVLLCAAGPGHGAPDGTLVIEDVRMGEPGDRWLDLMTYRKLERTSKDGAFGYALTCDGSDGNDLVFFFPRGAIDLSGEDPAFTREAMDVPGGRVWVPDRITARSMPRAYQGILYIEGKYRAEARGGIKAMEAFVLVFGAADAAPALTTMTARIFTSRATSSGGISLVEVTSAQASKTANTAPARIATSPTASSAAPPVEAAAKAERTVPTTSRLVRDKVTANATVKRATASTGGSPRALAKALEKAGYKRPANTAVHHIVARNAPAAEPAREVLQKFGIGMDDAVNGVFLPATKRSPNLTGASVHSTLHTNDYYRYVNELLLSARSRTEVEQQLARIRERLLAGEL